jgi:cytochrome b6-f complex iron-sulfur subunit
MADETQKGGDAPRNPDRRQFFIKLGVGSLIAAGAGTALFGYQFLTPPVLYEPSPIVNEGKPDQFPADSVTLDPAAAIYVVREASGFYALSAICTHLGCMTAWKPELNIIACPCHGSKFRKDGVKVAGPAPRPLPWLRMWLSDDGDLMVDRATQLPREQYVQV